MKWNFDLQAFFRIALLIVIVAASILIGSFLYDLAWQELIFDSTDVLTIFVVTFLLAFPLKINYTHNIFIFNLVLGIFLVSYYSFGQGLIIMLLLLIPQKLSKIL